MKGIILTALLALSSPAIASGIVATLANQAGGEILLTDASCPNNSTGRIAITTDNGGRIGFTGCAVTLPPDRILISWNGGDATVLKASNFTLVGTPTWGQPSRRGQLAKFKNR